MSGYTCPFCQQIMAISEDTLMSHLLSFYTHSHAAGSRFPSPTIRKDMIMVNFYKCPSCGKISIVSKGVGEDVKDINILVYPTSNAKQFPDYVPMQIRQDYEEAYAIVSLSPKSSATLSRRCLQGMIRDFWSIKENKLSEAIKALQDKVPPAQWKAIDAIRKVGNIGAHMEKDINLIIDIAPEEAVILIQLIELLIEKWYINRHDEEQLYNDVISISDDKQQLRVEK